MTDVIQEAGGMTEDADAKSVNLAASLSDEEVIYVANKDENVSVLDQTGTGQVSDKGGQAVSKDGKINSKYSDLRAVANHFWNWS